jgi:trans-aconitate methyltransferase
VVYDAAGGPARLTRALAAIPNAKVILADMDPVYIDYANEVLAAEIQAGAVTIVQADICEWRPEERVDVIVTQGVLHHLSKGEGGETSRFLENAYAMLAPDGVLIISDEVLADYIHTSDPLLNEHYRTIQAAKWYSYIIGSALEGAALAGADASVYQDLATDECEIFVDDAFQLKANAEQISLIKGDCPIIKAAALAGDGKLAESLAQKLLKDIRNLAQPGSTVESSTGLRGDYKDDLQTLLQSVESRFKLVTVQNQGPLSTIGAMVMLVLQRK